MFRRIWLHKAFIALCLLIFAVCVADFGFAWGIQKNHYYSSKNKSGSMNVKALNEKNVVQCPKCIVWAKNCIYPYKAEQCGIEGRIILKCRIDKNGEVLEATVIQAKPEGVFEKCALAGAKKLKFRPAMKDGKPINCIVKIPIRYILAKY